MNLTNLAVAIVCLLFVGCAPSLVYSPSVQLPVKPLEHGQLDVQIGSELFPETRKEGVSGTPLAFGINARLQYGFTDRFSMGIRGWQDLESRFSGSRNGFSFDAAINKPLGESSTLVVIPRIGFALYGDAIEGKGVGLSVLYHRSFNDQLAVYAGMGGAWGFEQLDQKLNPQGELRTPMGFAVLGHVGISLNLLGSFRANAEVSPLYHINTFDRSQHFVLSPQIGLGYVFGAKG